jgi:hypothetical protein
MEINTLIPALRAQGEPVQRGGVLKSVKGCSRRSGRWLAASGLPRSADIFRDCLGLKMSRTRERIYACGEPGLRPPVFTSIHEIRRAEQFH